MTTLSDIYTAINTFTTTHGYPPDTIHITYHQQEQLKRQLGITDPLQNFVSLYGIPVRISDTLALATTIK